MINWLIMKLIVRILVVLYVGCCLSSCGIQRVMTKEELGIINELGVDTAFRVLEISRTNDYKILRTKCTDLPLNDKETISRFIAKLKETLDLEQGVGIAAPQVGINRNLFLFTRIDKPGEPVEVAINPRILNHPKETVCFERDGCLSIPGVSGNSMRYPWIDVEYTNEAGKRVKERLEGYSRQGNFTAVIFQHEYDHLQGVLFTDKLCDIPTPVPSKD